MSCDFRQNDFTLPLASGNLAPRYEYPQSHIGFQISTNHGRCISLTRRMHDKLGNDLGLICRYLFIAALSISDELAAALQLTLHEGLPTRPRRIPSFDWGGRKNWKKNATSSIQLTTNPKVGSSPPFPHPLSPIPAACWSISCESCPSVIHAPPYPRTVV